MQQKDSKAKVGSETDSGGSRRPPGAARKGGAPGGHPGPVKLLSGSTRAWNFPSFAKTLKIKPLLTFAMFPYRNTYLFLLCSCWCLEPGCNLFFMSCCVYHIYVNIDKISCHVMLE